MDERISKFIERLKKELAGLPENEIHEAIGYYQEYLDEAYDEGKDIERVIEELESPKSIADAVRTEMSLINAQKKPGIRNFTRALRNAFRSVSKPIYIFLISIVELMAYSMVAMFFGGAFAAGAGGVVGFLALAYEGIRMPGQFGIEKLGTFGFALLTGSLLLMTAVYLYRGGKLFIRLSSRLIATILNKSGKTIKPVEEYKGQKDIKMVRTVPILLVILAAGILIAGISGLPWRYFVISNSMRPEGMIKNISKEYNTRDISRLSIITANSEIRIARGSTDRIVVSYEQPDWMEYEDDVNGGMLTIREKPNGRLPLFQLITLHESKTGLSVLLPRDFNPDSISMESTGGHIFLLALAGNMEAKTLNGSINIGSSVDIDSYDISAGTKNGTIFAGGISTGVRKGVYTEFYRDSGSDKKIDITSINGSINIK